MTPHRARQGNVDIAVVCHYADDPARRPACTLTAVASYAGVPLCGTCRGARSTLGKGQPPRELPPGPAVDVLDWLADANDQAAAADAHLTAVVVRARQAGHSWAAIGARLGVCRQAAQQRFTPPRPPSHPTDVAGIYE